MPAPIDPNIKTAIEDAYVNSNVSPEELAQQFGVSDRSIKNWAKDGGWDAKRKAKNVIAKNVIEFESARQSRENPRSIPRVNPEAMDSLEIVNQTISDLYGDLGDAIGKDKAAIANALKGLLEYRERLQPRTIGDLADLMIAFMREHNLNPSDVSAELKARWRAEKRA